MNKNLVLPCLKEYLKKKKISIKKCGSTFTFKCPFCGEIAQKIPNTNIVSCFGCKGKSKYNIIDIVKQLEDVEEDKDAIQFIKDFLNLDITTEKEQEAINKTLRFYKENNFDMVPVARNDKNPIEKDWTNKNHLNIEEWENWIGDGLNIGCKTGKISNITVLDVDQKPIPEEIKEIMGETLVQETANGFHLFYKYEEDLPKTRIEKYKTCLENDGGQVVISPSTVEGFKRNIKPTPIASMPEKLKNLIKKNVTVPLKTESEELWKDIRTENFKLNMFEEGNRNSSLVRLGGIFRKKLNMKQVSFVLNTLNSHNTDPLPQKEIRAMLRKLEQYNNFDESELAHKVLDYLKLVEEAGRNEIANTLVETNRGEDKKRIDKVLQYLIKEEKIIKRGKVYSPVEKPEWKTELINISKPIDFKMPYFDDVMYFNMGDLILIGSKNANGKTHIAINIIKKLVQQDITPYYYSLESGSRWAKIALQLGLKEGDFKWEEIANEHKIIFEDKSITVVDWLSFNNYAEADKVIRNLTEKLQIRKGVAIVFVQLRDNNNWLANDLIKQFPAMACRYIYDEDGNGEYGKFIIDKNRDSKTSANIYELPAKYNRNTKELKLIKTINNEKKEKE